MAATPSTSSKRRKVDSECLGFNPVWREKYLFPERYGKADVLTCFFPAWPATSLSGTHLARDPKKFADPWYIVTQLIGSYDILCMCPRVCTRNDEMIITSNS